MSAETPQQLAAAVFTALAKFDEHRTLEEARAAINEVGLYKARARVWESIDRITDAQQGVRSHAEQARRLKAELDTAVAEAEWMLDGRLVREGNKTFLVEACTGCEDESCTGQTRRQITADDARDWKAREALKAPPVHRAAEAVRLEEQSLQEARDELVVAEKFNQAARADLDAAIAAVTTLAASIRKETA